MPNVSVGAIIEKNGKILLTKRNVKPFKGAWVIPGGHIEQYEKAEDAVKREIREETGLNIKPVFLFYLDEIIPQIEKGFDDHNITLIFHSMTKAEAKINEESLEFGWFEPRKALELKLGFRNKEIIIRWLERN